MSGILDPKTRIMDTYVTQEGRRQLSTGKMRVEWVSFSDVGVSYESTNASGSVDDNIKIMFEPGSLPQDQITFEADDSGALMPFRNSNDVGILHGKLLTIASGVTFEFSTNNSFASLSNTLLNSSLNNFQNLYSIGTESSIFDDKEFLVNQNSIDYIITDNSPLGINESKDTYLDSTTLLHEDKKLSHLPNFMFLPPLNKLPKNANPNDRNNKKYSNLGNYYSQTGWQEPLTYEKLATELALFEAEDCVRTIKFDASSMSNNIMAQFFELTGQDIKKLDVINFGEHMTSDEERPSKHIFFIGKILQTDTQAKSFIHLFTIIFE
jgi:hypothetical protein